MARQLNSKADIRERLLALLDAHGVPAADVKGRALNKATDDIDDALGAAFAAGEECCASVLAGAMSTRT